MHKKRLYLQSLFSYLIISFISYCFITILIFHHRIPLFFTHYAMPDIDTEGGLWYQWYLTYIHDHQLIYDITTFTGYPYGFDLAFSPVFNLIYTIQVFLLDLIGFSWQHLIVVINISSFLVYPLSALSALGLTYYLTKNKVGSFISGIIYSFSFNTVLWGRGQMSINHIEGIPLYFLSLFYFLEKRNMFSLILSATCFGLLFKADAYYAFFSGIFTVPIIFLYKKESIIEKLKTYFSYYIPLIIVFILTNFNFILSNLYLFNKSLAVKSGRNSLPQNELFDVLYYYSSPDNSFVFFHLGKYGHIVSAGMLLLLLVLTIYLKKNRLYLLILSCFVLSLVLSTNIPSLFFINEMYFRFFSMFRSVARITVHTSLFGGMLIGYAVYYFMQSKRYKRIPQYISYSFFGVIVCFAILIALPADGTWYKSTSFSSLDKLYSFIRDNNNIKAIAAYPLTLNNGDNGFPPTFQLMGQLIYQKPLAAGLSPFGDQRTQIYFSNIQDITKPDTITTLAEHRIDTILLYNNFDELSQPISEVRKQLDNDSRVTYLGRFTAPKDVGYMSVIDRSKDISVYQIKSVVSENKTRSEKLFYTTTGTNVTYTKISAYRYVVRLSDVTKPTTLVFDLPFSSKWKLYPGNLAYTPNFLFLNRKDAIQEQIHVDQHANGWIIDPDNSTIVNAKIKGTKDMSFTIYFQPEAQHFIGSLVSIITVLGIGLYLVYSGVLFYLRKLRIWRKK